MSQPSRRQSMRLQEKAASVKEKEGLYEKSSSRQATNRQTTAGGTSVVANGRVAKPKQPTGRVVASRYMSSGNNNNNSGKPQQQQKTEAMSRTGAAWPSVRAISAAFDNTPANARPLSRQSSAANRQTSSVVRSESAGSTAVKKEAPVRAVARQPKTQTPARPLRSTKPTAEPETKPAVVSSSSPSTEKQTNTEISAEYLQWLMIEARSKIVFDEAKAAATEELGRLQAQAEEEKQKLHDEQRKLKLVREFVALDKWLLKNRALLEDMRKQVSNVSDSYTRFGSSLELTTRAMPISDVSFSDADALVGDMQRYVDAIQSHFPCESSEVKDMFAAADYLSKLGKLRHQEQELLSECGRLRESLEHGAALVSSQRAGERSETQAQ
ncbi:hypothetical protein IWW45_005263 [Coemansia sp. RSA 485]|nr:hypothetical protein IWW45_005263 [Coemansia sp. RSA 485]